MNDRELLELAAKAAGICLHPEDQLHKSYGNWGCDTTCLVCKKDPSDASWRPLADDGDALRLAMKLHIGIRSHGPDHWQQQNVSIALWDFGENSGRVTVEHGKNQSIATRRAIVRAAAEIGKAML